MDWPKAGGAVVGWPNGWVEAAVTEREMSMYIYIIFNVYLVQLINEPNEIMDDPA